MNLGTYLQLGNMAGGAYNAQQTGIRNQQQQQQINNILANDALRRQMLNAQVIGGGQGIAALGSMGAPDGSPIHPLPSPQAPAPSPGQNSAQMAAPPVQAAMPGAVAMSSPVPPMGAGMTTAPLPPQQAPQPPARPVSAAEQSTINKFGASAVQVAPALQTKRDKEALRILKGELQSQTQAMSSAPPQQQAELQGNVDALKRQVAVFSQRIAHEILAPGTPTPPMYSSAPPSPALASIPPQVQQSMIASLPPHEQGAVKQALSLAQTNMPVALLQGFVQKMKVLYPTATPAQMYYAVQAINPTLINQANAASKLAGLSIESTFRGLTSWAGIANAQAHALNAQTQASIAPSTIGRNRAMQAIYEQGAGAPPQGAPPQGAGTPGAAPQTINTSDGTAYLGGTLGSTSGPMGAGRQTRAFQQINEMGLNPGMQKPYLADLAASRSAATQLQQRASTLEATSGALDTQLSHAAQLAKQLNLNGPVVWNKGILKVGNQVIPTDSPIYQTFQQYDALVADASREAGAQQMFGKATVAGLKNGASIVSQSKGEGLQGVLEGLRAGAEASVAALNHTIAGVNVGPTIRLLSKSSHPDVAAKAFGFTPMSMGQLDAYSKQYNISKSVAAMTLATNPNNPYYVVGYAYGQ